MANTPYLSVIVPVYNEASRIDNLKKIAAFLAKQTYLTELIVVNDGSTDDTPKLLKKLQVEHPFKLIGYPKNRGKGYAIKRGMLSAQGQWHLFTDLDLSVSLEVMPKLLEMSKLHHIIIGTRRLSNSEIVEHQSRMREIFGRIFTAFSQWWLGLSVSDFTCGFKCFSQQASQDIFSQLKIERWGFDSEILFIAQQIGYEIGELPVKWKNDPRTKVKFPQDVLRSLLDLIEVRYHFWRGRYH